jgi:uncharacterized protein involved in exopolysaccharide biosynthesis
LQEPATKNIDLKEYLGIVFRRKMLLILPLLLVPLLALGGSFLVKPTYESSTLILIGSSNLLSHSFSSLIPGQEERVSPYKVEERLKVLKNQILSSGYLKRLITILKVPADEKIERTAYQIKGDFPDLETQELVLNLQVEKLKSFFSVNFKGENLVEISARAHNPSEAAQRAKTLGEIFIEESLANELLGIRGALEFSDEQLAIYRRRLQEAEGELRGFQERLLRESAGVDSAFAYNISSISHAVGLVQLELEDLKSKISTLEGRLFSSGNANLELYPNPRLQQLKTQLLSTNEQLGRVLTRYNWLDAKAVAVNQEVQSLLDQIKKEIQEEAGSQFVDRSSAVRNTLEELTFSRVREDFDREKLKVLQASLEELNSRLTLTPKNQQTLERLQRTVEENRRVYEMFSSQYTGAQISQAATQAEAEGKFKVIEPARIPVAPISPNRKKLLVSAILLGLALGLGAVIVAELSDHSFKKVEEVESHLGLRVVGTIPLIESTRRRGTKRRRRAQAVT